MKQNIYIRKNRPRTPGAILKLISLTIILALNISMFLLLSVYFFSTSPSALSQNIGVLLIVTFILNTVVALTSSDQRLLDYFYLIFTIVAMVAIPVVSTISTYSSPRNFSFLLILFLLFIGLIMISEKHRYYRRAFPVYRGSLTFKKVSIIKKTFMFFSKLILMSTLFIGVYVGYLALSGENLLLAEHALFFCISMIAITVLILKLMQRKALLKFLVGTAGIGTSLIFISSLVNVPTSLIIQLIGL